MGWKRTIGTIGTGRRVCVKKRLFGVCLLEIRAMALGLKVDKDDKIM